MEDYVLILDHLPNGRPDAPRGRAEPLAYGLGESQFSLLELIPKPGSNLQVGERVYIGKDVEKRTKIAKVKGRVDYSQLSAGAHGELPYVLLQLVKEQQERFVKFYNEAPPITTRYHSLELLPGLGKKTMQGIVDERRKGEFKSFDDLKQRVSALHAPDKLIAHRIELELSDPHQKYHLFTRPPAQQQDRMMG
jgi:putative nucleotide binding protein